MELKLQQLQVTAALLRCSNRTFMELKLFYTSLEEHGTVVLIAPLWN